MMNPVPLPLGLLLALAVGLTSCGRSGPPAAATAQPAGEQMGEAPTNRVDIPPTVRQNLGISFAKVQSRAVTRTLRLPGRFELLPTAAREYRAMAPGRVELLVEQYQHVEPGTPLYRIDSPRLRELQEQLVEADVALRFAQAEAESIDPLFEAHERHHQEIENSVELWTRRVEQLEDLLSAGGGRADDLAGARAALSSARVNLAETHEKEADLAARRSRSAAGLAAARSRREVLMASMASLTGIAADRLTQMDQESSEPLWRRLTTVDVTAVEPGTVDDISVTSGSWAEEVTPVIRVIRPDHVRFRARAMQSDLGRLENGLAAQVVPPTGGTLRDAAPLPGTIALAPTADPQRRTIEIILTPRQRGGAWARAGVSGFLEIVTAGAGEGELAIPLACVVRDGTQAIIFRRDPRNPDKAIRMEADLGADDGRWVVIRSGVAEGNEVVLDGVYQLMVATSATVTKGGHFHPDGTFHEDDH